MLQHPRDEAFAKAEEALGPDTLVLVRKIRTLQVGAVNWRGELANRVGLLLGTDQKQQGVQQDVCARLGSWARARHC